jgi:hypothetical protein
MTEIREQLLSKNVAIGMQKQMQRYNDRVALKNEEIKEHNVMVWSKFKDGGMTSSEAQDFD